MLGLVARTGRAARARSRTSRSRSWPTGAPSTFDRRRRARAQGARSRRPGPSRHRAIELSRRYPPDPDAPQGIYQVIRTGAARALPRHPGRDACAAAVDEEHYASSSAIGMRSAIDRADDGARPHAGRAHLRERPLGPPLRRAGRGSWPQELARRCATAIDNARLYSERAYIARTLQQSLLPVELPDIPGIEAAARFRPTGEGNEVGGDFYDVFETGGRGWAVVMGDVCGKGPDAAAVTALARYTLRAAAMRRAPPEPQPAPCSTRRCCASATTAASAPWPTPTSSCSTRARAWALASGGHPLPLLLRADGSVEQVGATGTLLGVVPDPDLEDRAVTLGPGRRAGLLHRRRDREPRTSDGSPRRASGLEELVSDLRRPRRRHDRHQGRGGGACARRNGGPDGRHRRSCAPDRRMIVQSGGSRATRMVAPPSATGYDPTHVRARPFREPRNRALAPAARRGRQT